MATFTCEVIKVQIKPHPNADALDIIEYGLFQSVMKKGLFKDGDLGVYIPEAAICPPEVIKACCAWDDTKDRGRLAGGGYDRVKAIKLRGVFSQGLVMPLPEGSMWIEGQDVQEEIGVKKYDPKIPSHFFNNGQPKIAGQFHGYTPNFDVENVKKHKNAFEIGEDVLITEKIHGTCCVIGCYTEEAVEKYSLNADNLYKGRVFVGTKNLTKRGIVYNPNDMDNIYARVPHELGLLDKLIEYQDSLRLMEDCLDIKDITVCDCIIGEIYGPVQDLKYGLDKPTFKAFECWYSKASSPSRFTPVMLQGLDILAKDYMFPWVPVLYQGPYSPELLALNTGNSILAPDQIREGIVIRSNDGEKLFKYVSEAYLLRKGETSEYE